MFLALQGRGAAAQGENEISLKPTIPLQALILGA